MYKVKNIAGKNVVGIMKVDLLNSKYHEPHYGKHFNFSRFTNGIAEEESKPKKEKFNLKNLEFDKSSNGDIDPIKNNTTDSNFIIDNEDAIIFDINKKNNKD